MALNTTAGTMNFVIDVAISHFHYFFENIIYEDPLGF